MIQQTARTGLTKSLALNRFNEARKKAGAAVEMIEQDDGFWTVTMVWDDSGDPVTVDELQAFDESSTRPTAASTTLAALAGTTDDLGSLSRRFESNGKPGAVGFDSTGGFSYGAYQIASNTGTMANFLNFVATEFPTFSTTLKASGGSVAAKAGADSFRTAWQSLASDPNFLQAQHEFISATHYEPFAKALIRSPLRLDLQLRSAVVRDVAWSVAVQHGAANVVFMNALEKKDARSMTDKQIIEAVYSERSNLARYFPRSTARIQSAVLNRFKEELKLALNRLA